MTLINPQPINDSALDAINKINASNAQHGQMMADRAAAIAAIKKSNASREVYLDKHAAALEAIEAADGTASGIIALHANDQPPAAIPDPDQPPQSPSDPPRVGDVPRPAEAALSLVDAAT